MERVFSNFHIDNDFYVLIFLFLLITVIISALIVVFMMKIESLHIILEKAKDIDRAKEKYLTLLKSELDEKMVENIRLEEKLSYLKNFKDKYKKSNKIIATLQEQIINQEKEHIDELHKTRTVLNKLKIHYKILVDQLEKAEEEAFLAKRAYEDLTENNKELEIRFLEQHNNSGSRCRMIE